MTTPRPRGTARDRLSALLHVVLCAFMVAVSVGGTLGLVREHALVDDLRSHGVATPGVVVRVTTERSSRSGVSQRRDVAYLDGLTTNDSLRCRCSAVGDAVTVVLDPDDPARAMTGDRLDRWTPLAYLPLGLLALASAAAAVSYVVLGVRWVVWRRRVARHGDPRALAQERARAAQDYIAFVNTFQRRPAPASSDPAEAALASWWATTQASAPDSREARLVSDVLALTRL